MCPLCIGTVTLIVSGSTSAGGLAAVLLRRVRRKSRGKSRVLTDGDRPLPSQARFQLVASMRARSKA